MLTIEKSLLGGKPVSECERLCRKALDLFPGEIDFDYYLARTLNRKGDFRSAREILLMCEQKLINAHSDVKTALIAVKPRLIFAELVNSALGLDDIVNTVKYATMVLADDKTLSDVLRPYIATLIKHGVPEDEIIPLLAKIYDFSDAKDIIFVARAAKDCGAIELARQLAVMAGELVKG